jgi:hypothetical protein
LAVSRRGSVSEVEQVPESRRADAGGGKSGRKGKSDGKTRGSTTAGWRMRVDCGGKRSEALRERGGESQRCASSPGRDLQPITAGEGRRAAARGVERAWDMGPRMGGHAGPGDPITSRVRIGWPLRATGIYQSKQRLALCAAAVRCAIPLRTLGGSAAVAVVGRSLYVCMYVCMCVCMFLCTVHTYSPACKFEGRVWSFLSNWRRAEANRKIDSDQTLAIKTWPQLCFVVLKSEFGNLANSSPQ